MTNHKTTLHPDYYKLTYQAISILDLPFSVIKDKYPDNPVCLMDYFEKDIKQKGIEVWFDNESASIISCFNDDLKCVASHLIFENEKEIRKYIYFLNKNFDYDYICSRWLMPDNFLVIRTLDGLTSCMFFRNK